MNFIQRMVPSRLPAVFYILIGIIVIRLIALLIMGPMPQDAYYFFYSQHPSLSYFDHPPAIAWLIRIFTSIFGKNTIAIKLGDTLLTALTVMGIYLLARKFLARSSAIRVIVLLLSTLMVSVLALISTPDAPLLFFWTLSLYALYKAVFEERRKYWLLAGILMGLAFDSKYTAIFLPAGMLLFLMLSAKHRAKLLSPWPWFTILVMVLVSLPVVIWNYQNHFASFAFQGAKRMQSVGSFQLRPGFTLGLIGHQLALLIPVLFVFLIRGVYLNIRQWLSKGAAFSDKKKFLLAFFIPIFLTFFILSPVYWIKINWMMPAYISGIILIAGTINIKWTKYQLVVALVVHLALLAELLFYPLAVKSDDTWVGWKELYRKADALKRSSRADFIFSADGYKTTAELNLFSTEPVFSQNVIGEQALHYDYIGTDLSKLKGKCAIFIDSEPGFKNIARGEQQPAKLLPYFDSVQQLKPIVIYRGGKPVRKFLVYLCHRYRPSALPPLEAEQSGHLHVKNKFKY